MPELAKAKSRRSCALPERFAALPERFAVLPQKDKKWHMERLLGALHMPCRKVHIIPCLLHRASCRLPKTPLCHKGLPRLSERLAARSNENRFLPPKTCGECLRFRGKGLWQICDSRQHFLATPSRHAGDVQRRRQARKLSLSLVLLRVIGIQAEGPFRSKWTANLCGNHGKPSWQSTPASSIKVICGHSFFPLIWYFGNTSIRLSESET